MSDEDLESSSSEHDRDINLTFNPTSMIAYHSEPALKLTLNPNSPQQRDIFNAMYVIHQFIENYHKLLPQNGQTILVPSDVREKLLESGKNGDAVHADFPIVSFEAVNNLVIDMFTNPDRTPPPQLSFDIKVSTFSLPSPRNLATSIETFAHSDKVIEEKRKDYGQKFEILVATISMMDKLKSLNYSPEYHQVISYHLPNVEHIEQVSRAEKWIHLQSMAQKMLIRMKELSSITTKRGAEEIITQVKKKKRVATAEVPIDTQKVFMEMDKTSGSSSTGIDTYKGHCETPSNPSSSSKKRVIKSEIDDD